MQERESQVLSSSGCESLNAASHCSRGFTGARMATLQNEVSQKSGLLEDPEGIQEEASLLTELAAVPSIGAAWVAPGSGLGQIITVRS